VDGSIYQALFGRVGNQQKAGNKDQRGLIGNESASIRPAPTDGDTASAAFVFYGSLWPHAEHSRLATALCIAVQA
jgi:hypothetical protein